MIILILMSEVRTSEEYIAHVMRQAREQEKEEVPSHAQLLAANNNERQHYLRHLQVSLGAIALLVVTFFAVKINTESL